MRVLTAKPRIRSASKGFNKSEAASTFVIPGSSQMSSLIPPVSKDRRQWYNIEKNTALIQTAAKFRSAGTPAQRPDLEAN
jgi:hypothetical protein